MTSLRGAAAAVGLMFAVGCAQQPTSPVSTATGQDIPLPTEPVEVFEERVPRNATFASLFHAHEVSDDIVQAVVASIQRDFNPRHLRANQSYRLERTVDGLLREFTYEIDTDRFLRVVGFREPDPRQPEKQPRFDVEVVPYEKSSALVSMQGEISRDRPSLIAAVAAGEEREPLAIQMAEVFSGDIDFQHDLHVGDSFDLLFEKVVRDGEFVGYGQVIAARFTTGGKTYEAYRYTPPGGKPGYYDREGRSLKRFFLASPLKFEPRVTSQFSYRRLHPITGRVRAHRGVDYGARTGTPVYTVANGTVLSAGWAGGAGRMVAVRHDRGYETRYLHLSSIANGIRPGARISQGQMIGRVGATGLATGPHLHYELVKNGTHQNPLVEHRKLPPGDPIPAAHRAAFTEFRLEAATRFVEPVAVLAEAGARSPGGRAQAPEQTGSP